MLKQFGQLIWRQSRDMSVLNYSKHIVYEIYTSQGYFYVSYNKNTENFKVLEGNNFILDGYKTNKSKTIFLPPLE